MNKQCKIEDTIICIEKARKFDIWIECPFIIGIPGTDLKKDLKNTLKFINKYGKGASQFHVFVYTPYPGTQLLNKAIEYGYKVPKKLEGWIDYGLHAENIVPWIPKKYSRITDQLSIYFQFKAGNIRKIIKTSFSERYWWFMLPIERTLYKISNKRIKHSFFYVPLEYIIIRLFIQHRDKILQGEKILY